MSLLGKASALASSLASKAKAAALNMSEVELKVMEATSLDPWGPHGTLMSDIAQASFDNQSFILITNLAEQRLTCTGTQWRHVYKTLLLLEFMAKRGPMRVTDYLQSLRPVLEKLRDNFDYKDENGRDQGINVRERSRQILALIYDEPRLKQEREKAASTAGKYTGVSSVTTPNASPSATPRSQRQETNASAEEDDAMEATRRRIENLKATGALPDSPGSGIFDEPATSKKTTKKLSEVKVNPLISAGLAGLGPPPTAAPARSSSSGSRPGAATPASSNSASAIDLLSDLVSDPMPVANTLPPAPVAAAPQAASTPNFVDDDWSNFSSAPSVSKPQSKIDIESMLNLSAAPPPKNAPLPMDAFSAFPTLVQPNRPQFPVAAFPAMGAPAPSAAPSFGMAPTAAAPAMGGFQMAAPAMPTAAPQASAAVFDPFSNNAAPSFLLPAAPKPTEKPKLGPETSNKKNLDPFADLLSL